MMKFKYLISIMVLAGLILHIHVSGQNVVNPASVNVNELSDSQIDRIIQEMQARGLTEDQAVALARSQGASQTQIDQILVRIQQRQMGQGSSTVMPGTNTALKASEFKSPLVSGKKPIKATEKNKKIFGFNIFNSENLTFEPSANIPTPKNYTLGISDQVVINVWGASQSHLQLTIDQNGSVNIPDIGPVYLSGLTFEKAQALIKERLTAIYSGMAGQYPNTWAEVSLGGLRSIKVNVLGEINAPGTYTLPSTASAFNALYLSGGPNENGSFREIRLIRDGETVHTIDVYDFLINANPAANVQLRDQDIIFVPTSKTMVQISGPLKRGGFFEMKPSERIIDLIRFAGGFSEMAYTGKLSVIRNNQREREIRDVPASEFGSFALQNGDSIRADSIMKRFSNRVAITGAVSHPGNYELTQGMKLSELIRKADGLKEDAFMNRGLVSRLKEDHTPENINFDLKEVMDGKNDILLKKEDAVTIRSISEMREERKVNIMGEVLKPQSFEYRENMTLGDLVFRAGGFLEDADVAFVELTRRLSYEEAAKVTNKVNDIHQFALTRDLKLSPADAAFKLQPFDEVYVRRAPGFREQATVKVTGEVTYAGTYSISDKSEKISDIMRRAGGLVPEAYVKGASLTRTREFSAAEIETRKQLMRNDSTFRNDSLSDKQLYTVGIELDKILANPGSNIDLLLKAGDVINVPRKLQTVKVSGSVLNPLALTYEDHLKLRKYIDRAGGYATGAKKSKAYVIYPNGTSASTRGIIFKWYPKVSPGSEIIVPSKPEKKGGDDAMKWISLAGVMTSMAVAVATLINLTK
jgi:protein involved in polysaccharide export with SLBB domain